MAGLIGDLTGQGSMRFERLTPVAQDTVGAQPFSMDPSGGNGELWSLYFRNEDGGYLLRFPGQADFLVSTSGKTVQIRPVPGVPADDIEHLCQNQVVPLLLSLQGRVVLHASAVELDEVAVVFMGPSGTGKSTLAASFAAAGMPFLTDDVALLDPVADGYQVLPYQPSIRLTGESIESLIRAGASIAPPTADSSEVRFLDANQKVFCALPRRLHRVYFLGHSAQPEHSAFEAVHPAQVMVQLMQHSFLLGLEDAALIGAHFDELARMAELPLFFRLDYPRRHDELLRVRQAIVRHARDECASRWRPGLLATPEPVVPMARRFAGVWPDLGASKADPGSSHRPG